MSKMSSDRGVMNEALMISSDRRRDHCLASLMRIVFADNISQHDGWLMSKEALGRLCLHTRHADSCNKWATQGSGWITITKLLGHLSWHSAACKLAPCMPALLRSQGIVLVHTECFSISKCFGDVFG